MTIPEPHWWCASERKRYDDLHELPAGPVTPLSDLRGLDGADRGGEAWAMRPQPRAHPAHPGLGAPVSTAKKATREYKAAEAARSTRRGPARKKRQTSRWPLRKRFND